MSVHIELVAGILTDLSYLARVIAVTVGRERVVAATLHLHRSLAVDGAQT